MTSARSGMTSGGTNNAIPATSLGAEGWEKPWSGPSGGQCVEMKKLTGGSVALRQSADPHGPALVYTRHEIAAFFEGIKQGLGDHLIVD